jgi:hypothetical protein
MKHKRLAATLLCASLMMCAAATAHAQSGRRAKGGTTSAPKPVSPPAEIETVTPASQTKPETQTSLIVAADEPTSVTGSATINANGSMMRGFVERLKKSSAFNIKVEKQMGRSRASDLAKEQQEAYVAWLQFGSDRVTARSNDRSDWYVDYVVFTPGTAKVKTSGRVYLRAYRRSVGIGGVPVGIPLPPIGNQDAVESALQQAGREAAERVMAEFDVIAR